MCSIWVLTVSLRANKESILVAFADGKLQLTYSGLPPVEGCNKGSNSRVVFYFECGNHVGQPQFERYECGKALSLCLENGVITVNGQ